MMTLQMMQNMQTDMQRARGDARVDTPYPYAHAGFSAYGPPTHAPPPPPPVAYQPPVAAYQPPPPAAYQPPVAAYQPPVAAYPAAAHQPPNAAAHQPPIAAAYQPPVAAHQPPDAHAALLEEFKAFQMWRDARAGQSAFETPPGPPATQPDP